MKRLFIILSIIGLLTGCNEYTLYTGKFVAFDPASSSVTSINELGDFTGTYYVHYSGTSNDTRFAVTFEVIPGNGLVEGVDYEMETSGKTLNFMPGIFSLPIRIHWIPNEIDESKDNSVILRLTSAPDDITLGYPGPDKLNKEIKILKYKN